MDKSGGCWLNNALLDTYGPIIGAHGIAVYAVLARFTDQTGQSCYPSYHTIAQRLKLSRGKVIAIMHQLEACGLVRREPRTDEAGDAQLNRYMLLGFEPAIRDEVVHEENQVVHEENQGSASGALGVVHIVHPNKTYREQDLENRDGATSSTDNTPEPGRDADLDSALPSSGRPQPSEAMHATSPVSLGGETRHTSAAVDDEGNPMNLATHGRRDDEAVDRGGAPKPQTRRNAQATQASSVPETFPITEAMRAWAQERVPGVDVEWETEQFLDYHRAKGNVLKDWEAAWRTWMRHASRFQEQRATSRASSSQTNMNSAGQKALVL